MNSLLVGLGCFALHAVVTLVWLRLSGRTSPVARHAASSLATHALGVASAAQFVGPFAYWPAAAVSGFLAVCWLFAFSAVYKSVSLRILTQLDCTPGHAMPMEAVTEDYVRPEFATRASLLVTMGCATEADGAFEVTEKGTATARRIAGIQHACGIAASGLYGEATDLMPLTTALLDPEGVGQHSPGQRPG
ncbi:MAG TPA: hypothetical protein VM529_01905 [Gemmata sp.]|nr:hypothetical protein [Gemmata sp.]